MLKSKSKQQIFIVGLIVFFGLLCLPPMSTTVYVLIGLIFFLLFIFV